MFAFGSPALTAMNFDANVGLSVSGLIGSLGAAGAVVTVTHYFLSFLRTHGDGQNQVIEQFTGYHAESQRKFQEQLERLSDRLDAYQHDFQVQVTRMTESQDVILQDAIAALQSMENTTQASLASIRGMEKTIGTLRFTVGALDTHLCDGSRDGARGDTARPTE